MKRNQFNVKISNAGGMIVSNLLLNPPKHQCHECQSQCDYHLSIGKYAIFSCPTCESKFSIWRSFAYFAGVSLLVRLILRMLGITSISDTFLVALFAIGMAVLVAFSAFGNHIWTLKIKRLE
ncbi:hypothetical protein LU276_00765 [Moraxella haemolytica]|uniref:hypothetical protein n=1 Tax=Moraxella haemolytica TaxID=2904119 RepID=UPI002542AB77|nr:hypothetical protein [Moraxella sp. ZY171148]WII95420.1 hypothetical protein LU276_00765 [Moraxella sp. ZY171148]